METLKTRIESAIRDFIIMVDAEDIPLPEKAAKCGYSVPWYVKMRAKFIQSTKMTKEEFFQKLEKVPNFSAIQVKDSRATILKKWTIEFARSYKQAHLVFVVTKLKNGVVIYRNAKPWKK